MGVYCCKSGRTIDAKEGALFGGKYNTGRGIPQLLFLGSEGAGKTTLMYSTVLPGWTSITTSMQPTVALHYEEITRESVRFGMWDVSGSEAMQPLWPLFYRYINLDCVIFVVSILDNNLLNSKLWIRRLMHEDDLRNSLIIIVINTYDMKQDEIDPMTNCVISNLELEESCQSIDNKDRCRWFIVNAKEGEKDDQWKEILKWIINVLISRYHSNEITNS